MKSILKMLCLFVLCPTLLFAQEKSALPKGGIEKFIEDIQSETKISDKKLLTEFDFEFTVSDLGKLDTFRFIRSSSDAERDLLAKTIVDLGNWDPAMKNGHKVSSVVRFPSHLVSETYIQNRLSGVMPAEPAIGLEEFRVLFQKSFRYPDAAIKAGVSGTYTLTFTVKEDGTLTNIKLLDDPGFEILENATRALKRAGRWKPASSKGKYLKTTSSFDFTLSLKEFRRHI